MSATSTVTSVVNLYIGLFGRAPDGEGLSYWVNQIDAGASLATVAQNMYNTDAARPYYPLSLTNDQFVTTVYRYVLGREPDAEGLAYWVGQLSTKSKGELVVDMTVAASTYDITAAGATADGIAAHNLFANKQTASDILVQQQLNHGPFSGLNNNTILNSVTADSSAVATLFGLANSDLNSVAANAVSEFAAEHTDLAYSFEPAHAPGNTYQIASATSFANGGSLASSSETDIYRVTLLANHTYEIRAETSRGNSLDPQISWVKDSGGSVISGVANADYGLGHDAQISFTPSSSGEYQIGVQAQNGTTGNYWFELADLSGAVTTPDPIAASANSSYTVTVDHSFATRKVTFTLTGGQEYLFSLAATTGGNPLNAAQIQGIYDSTGKLIDSSSVSASNGSASLHLTPAASGSYYAIVKDGFDDTGVCQFSYTTVSTAKSAEPSRTMDTMSASPSRTLDTTSTDLVANTSTSGSITANSSTTGVVYTSGDHDWYAIWMYAGVAYTIDLQGSGSSHGTLYDPLIYGIYNAAGSYISGTGNDDYTGRDSHVVYTPTSSGTYYIDASAFGSYTGSYTLSVTAPISSDLAASTATTGSVTAGSSTTGTIDSSGDQDWFAVSFYAGYSYTIDLQGSPSGHGSLSDTVLTGIYNSSGSLISGTGNDDYTSADSHVVFSPTSSGTYYIAAAGYGSATGTYTLSVGSPVSTDLAANTTTTGSVAAGSSNTGTIDSSGDQDWFAVSLYAGYSYTIDLQGSPSGHGTLADTVLTGIYNSSGTLISGTGNDDYTTHDSHVVFSPSSSGTYYIAAAGYGSNTGTYTLSVGSPVSTDLAASTATTGSVSAGSSTTSTINSSGDQDWFAVSLYAGYSYTIDLQGSPSSHGTLSDPLLYGIYNSSGSYISGTSNDDYTNYDSHLVFTPSSSGTYYLCAAGVGSTTGTYTLSVGSPTRTDLPAAATTTGSVAVNGSTTGTIDSSGDQDWFAVQMNGGTAYTIDLQGSPSSHGTLSDTVIYGIYNASGTLISGTYNDDYSSADSHLVFTPTSSGTYYISAAAFGSNTGTYTLSVTAPISTDLAASTATTGSVAVGGSTTSSIETSGDHDWFAVSLSAGNAYTIDLQGSPSSHGTLTDTVLYGIYNASGSYISSTYNDDYTSTDSHLVFTPTSSGTYYIDAMGYGSATGTYTLSVSTPTSTDLAATTATTGSVSVGSSATSTINYSGDQDWFAVSLTAGATYSVNLQGSPSSHGTLADPVIYGIYNSSGTYVSGTSADDSYSSSGSFISYDSQELFTPTSSGTYYIAATAYGSNTGTYSLSVSSVGAADVSGNATTTASVTVGGSTTGTINVAGDHDWFAVSLSAGTQYNVNLQGSPSSHGTLADPLIYGIYTASSGYVSGTQADDTYSGSTFSSLDSQEYFTPTSSGTYYIDATGFGNNTGTYTLSVAATGTADLAASTATTGTVTVGGTASSSIGVSGDQDWFAVSLSAGHSYSVALQGSASSHGTLSDPVIYGIYDASGSIVANTYADDSYTASGTYISTDSQETFTPSSSGTYYVSAAGFGTATGSYTLAVNEASSGDLPANSSTSGAALVNGQVADTIDTAGDRDWYAVSLTAGHRYQIDLMGTATNSGTLSDPYLYGLYNSAGTLLANSSDDDNGEGANSRVSIEIASSGTYYISAGAYGTATGTAMLGVTDLGVSDIAANTATTGTISVGGSVSSNIYQSGDQDWFAATLTGGTTYTINLNALTSSATPLSDPLFAGVYNSSGSLISGTGNDDFGGTTNSQVSFTPTSSGTYYLAAAGYSSYTGYYTLSVSAGGSSTTPVTPSTDIAGDASTTGRIAVGSSVTTTIGTAGDRDWYAISLTAGHSYDIALNGHDGGGGTLADPYIYGVYNASSQLQSGTANDDGGSSFDSFVNYTPTSSGTYYISAGGYGDATGTATLSVSDSAQPATPTPDPTPPSSGSAGTWTIMVYVDGDNNLESAAVDDVNEMEAASLPSGVRVAVLLDRASGYDTSNGNWTDARFGLISHDNNINTLSSNLTSLGEVNMGATSTLTDFINRSAAAAPASHYALVLWDHGGGIAGVTWDNSANSDNLSLNEVNQAISASNVSHFDVLGYDACLMAVLDQYSAVQGRADYIVASENTEPNDGWDYTNWLALFNSGSNISAQQLTARADSTYAASYGPGEGATLSTVNTTQIAGITSAWSAFTQAVVNAGSSAMTSFRSAAAQAQSWETNYFDLNSLMTRFININGVASLDQAAQAVITAESTAVTDHAGAAASGMTVYLPDDTYSYTNSSTYPVLQLAGVQAFYQMYTH